MRKILLVALIFQTSLFAGAETCFKNKREFDKLDKQALPKILRTMPLFLSGKIFSVMAVGKMVFDPENENEARIYLNCNKELEKPVEGSITVCVEGANIIVRSSTPGVKPEIIPILPNENGVKLRGKLIMEKSNEKDFSMARDFILEKQARKLSIGTPTSVPAATSGNGALQ